MHAHSSRLVSSGYLTSALYILLCCLTGQKSGGDGLVGRCHECVQSIHARHEPRRPLFVGCIFGKNSQQYAFLIGHAQNLEQAL